MHNPSEKYINFLHDLHNEGVTLPQDQIDLLIQKGRIKIEGKPTEKPKEEEKEEYPIPLKKTEEEKAFDDELVVVMGDSAQEDIHIFDPKRHVDKKFLNRNNISREDWIPKDIVYHEEDFVRWIDSFVFYGFQNMIAYEKFELYKKQAYDWLMENDVISKYQYPEDIAEFKMRELDRMDENSLYALNKYGKVKDAIVEGGWRTYTATPAHEVMIYLDDCRYSMLIGKPRQIAATSTLALMAGKKIIFKKNFFIKFITEDKDKGLEIYEDKIKASFTAWPEWVTPKVLNWSGTHLRLGSKGDQKGRNEGVGSSILTDAPSITAIAGGSPNTCLVDEAGNISIFSKMMQDANPTMSSQDPVTKKIKMNRQFIGWGTGGDMERGGKSFEFEFMVAVRQWKERKWGSGIIPIFFDWTTRPGIDQEFYDQKKAEAFAATGPDAAAKRIKFYQQFPSTIEDMFLSSQATLVDIDFIHRNERRIDECEVKTKYGFFEPIYDTSKPMPEGFDIPYAITGAKFIQTDAHDPRCTTIMFQPPVPGWRNRYYQGDDPINAESGLSNMASAIWDAEYNTAPCVVDHREQNYKYTYLQCMLMGIYYDTEESLGVKDLTESNIGTNYMDYKSDRGREKTVVWTSELPDVFRNKTGSQARGLDNKGVRNKSVIDNTFELLQAYGDRVYIRRFYEQLKSFTCKETDAGGVTWGPIDRRYYKDDVIWAITYAYICAKSFSHLKPQKITGEAVKIAVKYPLYRDSNYKLRRSPQKVRKYGK
jgi:hypothetical protein